MFDMWTHALFNIYLLFSNIFVLIGSYDRDCDIMFYNLAIHSWYYKINYVESSEFDILFFDLTTLFESSAWFWQTWLYIEVRREILYEEKILVFILSINITIRWISHVMS
jgi:hypothetical protein